MLFKDKYPEETLQMRNPPPSQGGAGVGCGRRVSSNFCAGEVIGPRKVSHRCYTDHPHRYYTESYNYLKIKILCTICGW